MERLVINVAKDFSRAPAGRFISDGPNSGERFREQFLIPALESGRSVRIEMDGTRGYGSSFLEEAFGGLRRKGFVSDVLFDAIEIVSNDRSLSSEIHNYWRR